MDHTTHDRLSWPILIIYINTAVKCLVNGAGQIGFEVFPTDDQFAYAAAVDGIMVREKPATVFLLGAFFAESLILAETGNYIGAIQIAGTARPAQLPFFIAACDFTLIGEELFAASAYLSGEPMQLGSLKGQDVGKALTKIVIVIGALSATIGQAWDVQALNEFVMLLRGIFSTR